MAGRKGEVWVDDGMGSRIVFININDMYNNDVGKGGVRVSSIDMYNNDVGQKSDINL